MYSIYIMYKVYKIVNDEGLTYYGSTKMSLEKRLQCHKNLFLRYLDNKHGYSSSFDVLRGSNPKIELVEELEEDRNKALNKEKQYITLNECVNKNNPILTDEEKEKYRQELKNNEYFKNYYLTNKEKFKQNYELKKNEILEKKKVYYQKNKQARDAYTKEYMRKKRLSQI